MPFDAQPCFDTGELRQDFKLTRILVHVFRASMRGVSLGFASQGNESLPIYGHLNRQDRFVLNDGGFVKH